MALNYELERHIVAAESGGNTFGSRFLQGLQQQFRIAAEAGLVPVLPIEIREFEGSEISDNEIHVSEVKPVIEELRWQGWSFGPILRSLLAKSGVTQRRLALELGMNPQSVTRWVNDTTRPSISAIDLLSSKLELTPTERLGLIVLSGKSEEILERTRIKMRAAVEDQDFRRAEELKNQLEREQIRLKGGEDND